MFHVKISTTSTDCTSLRLTGCRLCSRSITNPGVAVKATVLTINIRACRSVPAEPLPLTEWSFSETHWPFSFHLSFPRTEQLSADVRLSRKGPPPHIAFFLSGMLLLEPIGAAVPVHVIVSRKGCDCQPMASLLYVRRPVWLQYDWVFSSFLHCCVVLGAV